MDREEVRTVQIENQGPFGVSGLCCGAPVLELKTPFPEPWLHRPSPSTSASTARYPSCRLADAYDVRERKLPNERAGEIAMGTGALDVMWTHSWRDVSLEPSLLSVNVNVNVKSRSSMNGFERETEARRPVWMDYFPFLLLHFYIDVQSIADNENRYIPETAHRSKGRSQNRENRAITSTCDH